MSITDVAPEAAPFVSDYVPGTVGHVVLAAGRDLGGTAAVAVWQVSPTGQPTGAWILTTGADAAGADADPAKARRLLGTVGRRSLVGWSGDGGDGIGYALERLATAAATKPAPGWEESAVYLPAALAEIAERRRLHAEAVAEYQRVSKSKVAPLAWPHEVPTDATSLAELADVAGLTTTATASEAAARALLTTRLLSWTVGLWQETEQVRLRRRYLVDRFGPASALPERWLARLRAANTSGTALPVTPVLASVS